MDVLALSVSLVADEQRGADGQKHAGECGDDAKIHERGMEGVVVLPAPLSPRSAKSEPCSTAKEILSTAFTAAFL